MLNEGRLRRVLEKMLDEREFLGPHGIRTGLGIGASHQTGWTGIVARAMHLFATTTPGQVLELGKAAAVTEVEPRKPGPAAGRRQQ